MESGPPTYPLTPFSAHSRPTLCFSHTGLLSAPQTLRLWLWSRRAPRPECLPNAPSPLQIPLVSQGSVQTPLLSGSLPGFSSQSYSPLPLSFQTVCAWLPPAFPIRTCAPDNLCIFLTISPFLFWVPVTRDGNIQEAFRSPLGMTSRVPSVGSAADFTCSVSLESVSSPLL